MKYTDYRHSYVSTPLSYGFAFSIFLLIWLSGKHKIAGDKTKLYAFGWPVTMETH